MTAGATLFMAASWLLVLGLTAWSFARILGQKDQGDHAGADPAGPPTTERPT